MWYKEILKKIYKTWLKFTNRLFNEFNILSFAPTDFSQSKIQENGSIILVEDGPNYAISIHKNDNSILKYECGAYCIGTEAVGLIRSYFSPPKNVKYEKINLLDFY